MNTREALLHRLLICEVVGCERTAISVVQDLGSLHGSGPFPIDIVSVGPLHQFCDLHSRGHHSYKRENGEWVRQR